MDTSETTRPQYELARLSDLPPALRAPLPPASRPASDGGGLPINPRLVLRGLARHWWQALALWVVGSAALAALVYLKFQPTYRSFSLLQIERNQANPYGSLEDPRSIEYLQTQIQLITSPRVLSVAKLDPKVASQSGVREAPDAEQYLREMIKVAARPNTSLIEVAAEAERAHEAADVVNAVVRSYLDANKEWSEARTNNAIRMLVEYEKELGDKVEAQQKKLIELFKEAEDPRRMLGNLAAMDGGVAPAASGEEGQRAAFQVDVDEYERLSQALLELEYEEIEARADLEAVRRQAAATDPRVWVDRRIEQVFLSDERVNALRGAIRDVEARIAEARTRIRNPGDPALSRLMSQRQILMEQYEQLWSDLEPTLRAQLAAEETHPVQIVLRAEQRLLRLERERQLLQQKLDLIELADRSESVEQLEISFAMTKLKQYQAMEQQVQRRLEVLRFESRPADTITVIDPATPGLMLSNKRDKFLALTPLAMLGLVLGLVTLVELRSGRVGGTEELSGRLAAEVFAVPPLPTTRDAERARLEGPGYDPKFEQFVQQLDHLRVALCGEGGQDGRGRCVLITSAVGGEGKTTLAAQLAVRCAEAGASTVLIDADLRRATLGRLFEVPDCPGLSDVLRGDAQLEDALVPISQVGGCQLLPAGSPEAYPNRILRGKAFAPMLERLRRSFDVVIIDTSPVLPVPDALILGRLADGAVIATRHDQSRFPAVERANGLLTGAGIPVLGVVVNGARTSDRRFGTGYATYTYRSDRISDPGGGVSGS
ncbi:exopolysaccharide transport family protein [Tautonia sociabilis]|uniref:Polysaccharide biosynthesis tyrosine autokinase n=1 Tax=Tautonia sociabilis TaxID=2080755 RepID=A0A432MFP3_9BACT|nr:polysaccharide biosynthesis tyrosine autokinase [Tautonia sociabilis]RUL84918.1 polysaccharide biosynthesis tyrosine autokinase [Tautonia sociabilis]